MSLVDADKVQSFSILPQSCGHCGVLLGFSYVYPVYLFTFIDYLVRCFLLVLVYSCTWFCDDIFCILQAQ